MGASTGITWTDSTFNPWSGCTKVSEGCKFCYAERDSHRNPAVNGIWGPNGNRVARVESYWKKAHEWNANWGNPEWRESNGHPDRKGRVFCASLADVFEQWDGKVIDNKGVTLVRNFWTPANPPLKPKDWDYATLDDLRLRLFQTIMETPNLNWLLLTKRIDQVMPTLIRCRDMVSASDDDPIPLSLSSWIESWINGNPPENVWLGTSVEDQATADARIPHLLKIPAKVRWISAEPLLGPVDFRGWIAPPCSECGHSEQGRRKDGTCSIVADEPPWGNRCHKDGLDWLIVGGESGSQARPFDLGWARSIRDQCKAAGTPYFFKQAGAVVHDPIGLPHPKGRIWFKDRSGSDPSEWPEGLRVQEFPS